MNQTSPISRPSDRKKWILILLFTFIFLLGGSLYLLFNEAEKRAEKALLELVNSELSGESEVIIGHFKLSLFPLGVTADEIELFHHTLFDEREFPQKPLDVIRDLNIDRVSVKQFRLWRYLFKKTIHIGELKVIGANIEFVSGASEKTSDDDSAVKSTPLHISEFHFLDGYLSYFQNAENENPTLTLDKISINSTEIDLSEFDEQPFPQFSDLEMQVQKLGFLSENKHYELELDSLHLNSINRDLSFKNVQITPLLTATEMAVETGHQLDRFDASLAHFLMLDFDLKSWLLDGKLTASKIELAEPIVHIDRDRSFPRRDREDRPMPHSQFINLDIPVQIDTVHAIDGTLRYLEFYSDESREGFVLFDHIDLKAFPFQNISVEDSLFVRAKTRFMNVSDLNLKFDFSLQNDAAHIVSGSLDPMDMTTINDPLDGLILMRLKSGELDRLDFWFYADNKASAGNLLIIYKNLEVQFYDDDLNSDRNRDQFKSFIANTFAIRSDNPSDDPRTGKIEYERDLDKSMFNYWLRSLATGLEDSIKRF